MLVVGERARSVAVQVEGAEADRSHLEREAEDGPHAGVDGRAGEGEPAGRAGLGQIGFEHGPVLVVGVHARALAERVLQLLDEGAHLVGGAHRAPGHVAGHQHDPRAGHAGDLGAHLAQPPRLQLGGAVADEPGEDPQTPGPTTAHRRQQPGRPGARASSGRRAATDLTFADIATRPARNRSGPGSATARTRVARPDRRLAPPPTFPAHPQRYARANVNRVLVDQIGEAADVQDLPSEHRRGPQHQ